MPIVSAAVAVIDAALDTLAALFGVKDLGDEAGAFGSDLDALVTRSYRRRIGTAMFATQMDALLAQYIRASYLEGLAEGGIDESEIDFADLKAIREMVAAQKAYVDGFAEAVMAAKREEDARAEIDRRISMWGKSIRAAAVAGVNSAKAGEVVIFGGIMGKEPDGCATCLSLMGSRHRRQWYVDRGWVPGIPGNCKQADGSGFECCSYECNHTLIPVGAPLKVLA